MESGFSVGLNGKREDKTIMGTTLCSLYLWENMARWKFKTPGNASLKPLFYENCFSGRFSYLKVTQHVDIKIEIQSKILVQSCNL